MVEYQNSAKTLKGKNPPGQSVARIKYVPEMCGWIQGQQNANSIDAFIIQEYWRLYAAGSKKKKKSPGSYVCEPVLLSSMKKRFMLLGSVKRFRLGKSNLHIVLLKFVIVGLW